MNIPTPHLLANFGISQYVPWSFHGLPRFLRSRNVGKKPWKYLPSRRIGSSDGTSRKPCFRRVTNPRRVVDDGGFDSVPICKYIYMIIYDVCVYVQTDFILSNPILKFQQPRVGIQAMIMGIFLPEWWQHLHGDDHPQITTIWWLPGYQGFEWFWPIPIKNMFMFFWLLICIGRG